MTSTAYFSKPLVTPSILFMVCSPGLIHRAHDVAGLLEEACAYQIVDTNRAFEQLMEGVEAGTKPSERILIMPAVANDRAGRTVCYNVLCERNIPLHAAGCIAIMDNTFPPTKLFDPLNKAETDNWISTDFMCVIRTEVTLYTHSVSVILTILGRSCRAKRVHCGFVTDIGILTGKCFLHMYHGGDFAPLLIDFTHLQTN
ncbi:hypothetical protein GNI_140680 [Gregarina niphandrodes]|uniref:Uncharacterized protein n=1 Tax=Gregarina niphandrodes TaxID=110365 RepID=A0A023B0A9_GRENI|nr:hypothetical protein GNI_140680 [Gregarina niphandrodes]EZG45092.1 hypothetical protein GNI_140680 [Gregarina niphandrodes]|eukprot:XP_011132555.1 hypothetical protein GNI_140680 [Gregarina niphandrodes]